MHPIRPLLLTRPMCAGLLLGQVALAQTPAAGTAELTLVGIPQGVQAELRASAATLIGFEGKPRTREQKETLALAVANLQTGDGLLRFNAQALCRLEHATVDADPTATGGRTPDLGASYRFACERPEALASVAVALFVGFPALAEVRVRYTLPRGAGEALLSPLSPVVAFVPLR